MYSWWWVRLSPETCRVKPMRIKNAIVASCWTYFTIGHKQHMYSWWWVRLLSETCRVKPLRIKNAIVASCWTYFTTVWSYPHRPFMRISLQWTTIKLDASSASEAPTTASQPRALIAVSHRSGDIGTAEQSHKNSSLATAAKAMSANEEATRSASTRRNTPPHMAREVPQFVPLSKYYY